jgi:hypothetical protein
MLMRLSSSAKLSAEDDKRISMPPMLPPAVAPSLRVRLAAARDIGDNAELAGIAAADNAARDKIARFRRRREDVHGKLDKLRGTLTAHFGHQARRLSAEDEALGELYHAADVALKTGPINLAAAQAAVDRYVAELNRRLGLEGNGG